MANPTKIPPQSIDAEKALLGSLMMDKDGIIKIVDFIKPGDFYKTAHGQIYQAIFDTFQEQEPIDFLTLSQRLKEKQILEEIGGNTYLTELLEIVPTASHINYYAKIVREKKVLRDLIQASEEISILGFDEIEDIDIILDKAEKAIFNISQKSLTQNFFPIKSELTDAAERLENVRAKIDELRGIPTGFKKLDDRLAGLQKGDLILLAARPSLGKTSLCLDIARNAAIKKNIPIGVFSLEMSKEQVVDRVIAAQAGISLWKLRTGKISDDDHLKIQEALGQLHQAPIYIDDAASSTVLQMRAMARRLQAERGLGLLIVDYLQLIEARSARDNMVQQVTEISRGLKGLAKELNIPVLALSQLSRAVEQRHGDHKPKLADLRESGSLEQDADVVLFIYKDDKYNKEAKPNNVELMIAKHRNGPIGKVDLFFDQDSVSFKEITEDYDEEFSDDGAVSAEGQEEEFVF